MVKSPQGVSLTGLPESSVGEELSRMSMQGLVWIIIFEFSFLSLSVIVAGKKIIICFSANLLIAVALH